MFSGSSYSMRSTAYGGLKPEVHICQLLGMIETKYYRIGPTSMFLGQLSNGIDENVVQSNSGSEIHNNVPQTGF